MLLSYFTGSEVLQSCSRPSFAPLHWLVLGWLRNKKLLWGREKGTYWRNTWWCPTGILPVVKLPPMELPSLLQLDTRPGFGQWKPLPSSCVSRSSTWRPPPISCPSIKSMRLLSSWKWTIFTGCCVFMFNTLSWFSCGVDLTFWFTLCTQSD